MQEIPKQSFLFEEQGVKLKKSVPEKKDEVEKKLLEDSTQNSIDFSSEESEGRIEYEKGSKEAIYQEFDNIIKSIAGGDEDKYKEIMEYVKDHVDSLSVKRPKTEHGKKELVAKLADREAEKILGRPNPFEKYKKQIERLSKRDGLKDD